jgi:hypothetical protein
MKGPGLRLLVDVRRSWKCPRCGYEERVGAEVTTVACPCCPGIHMRLIEQDRVYADELRKLRDRPQPTVDVSFEASPDAVIISASEHVEEPPPGLPDAPAATTDAAQAPPKRRGKRPHKQSRREQHRVQQQSAAQSADSEE